MDALTVPGTLDALPMVRNYVLEAAQMAGLDARAAHRLRRAVVEVAENVVTHGYAAVGWSGAMILWVDIEPRRLTIYIEDAGIAYTPNLQPPEDLDLPPEQRRIGGLGLYLAVRSVDTFRYDRIGTRNRHTLSVDLPASENAPHDFP